MRLIQDNNVPGFFFNFTPINVYGASVHHCLGVLRIVVNGESVWGEPYYKFMCYWEKLLIHIIEIRQYLISDQIYPSVLHVSSPSQLFDETQQIISSVSDVSMASEVWLELLDFVKNHNLALCQPSLCLPSLFMIRNGNIMRIVAPDSDVDVNVNLDTVIYSLDELCLCLASSIRKESDSGRVLYKKWFDSVAYNEFPVRYGFS